MRAKCLRVAGAVGGGLLLCAALLTGCAGAPQEKDSTSKATQTEEVEDLSKLSDEQYVKRVHELIAETSNIKNPPQVEVIRFVDIDESDSVIDNCMREKGFDPDDTGPHDEAYLQQHKLAQYICHASYPPPKKYTAIYTEDDIGRQYDWTIEYVIPCLRAHGYKVGDDAPSRQAFIDGWFHGEAYFPMADVAAVYGDTAVQKVQDVCLQEAPGSVMFGEISIAEWKKLGRGGWWTGD